MFGGNDYYGGRVPLCIDGVAYTVFAKMSMRIIFKF